MPIFAVLSQKLQFMGITLAVPGVTEQNFIKFVHNVAGALPFNIFEYELRYSKLFRNASVQMKVSSLILPEIGCHHNVF